MVQPIDYEKVIVQGIKGLPNQYLSEIADFVIFLRQKSIKQYNFQEELSRLNESEINHLEEEFKDFDTLFPKE
ncbi:MAG: hypothetical protein U0X91_12880 [Spirosomataceae bacterium]